MEFSPQTVRSAGFKTVKKGYDPAEVDAFKDKVASAIEAAQNQATAMEARARAAVAKLQEMSQSGTTSAGQAVVASDEDAETISRTLLLAQRTADNTIASANQEAETITVKARVDATTVIDNARSMADKLLEEARVEARRSAESERIKAENEVQALLARRGFLLSDVEHLEQHLVAQRERLRDAAVSIQELVERVPGGLAEMRRPLLSASAEAQPGEPGPEPVVPATAPAAPAAAEPTDLGADAEGAFTPPSGLAASPGEGDDTNVMNLDLDDFSELGDTLDAPWSGRGASGDDR